MNVQRYACATGCMGNTRGDDAFGQQVCLKFVCLRFHIPPTQDRHVLQIGQRLKLFRLTIAE